MAWRFSIQYFFNVVLNDSRRIIAFGHSSNLLILFSSYLSIQFFCCIRSVPTFSSRIFCFLYIQLLVYFRVFSSELFVELSFVILKSPVLIVLLDPVSVSLSPSSFAYICGFISSSSIVRFVWWFVLAFSSQHISVNFPSLASSLVITISLTVFLVKFLSSLCISLRVTLGTMILSLTNFAPY